MELQDTMDIVDIGDTMLLPRYQLLMAGWGIGWNSGVTSCHWQPRGTDVGAAGDMVAHCCYPARALRALGLLLADGTPTVGGGKTF